MCVSVEGGGGDGKSEGPGQMEQLVAMGRVALQALCMFTGRGLPQVWGRVIMGLPWEPSFGKVLTGAGLGTGH